RAGPRPRRADELGRPRHRGGGDRCARAADAEPHDLHHRPPRDDGAQLRCAAPHRARPPRRRGASGDERPGRGLRGARAPGRRGRRGRAVSRGRLRVVVTGLVAQHPRLGGVTWDSLQYPLGLAALGHDVYYLEDSGEWPYTLDGGPSGSEWVARDPTPTVAQLARVMERFGLRERWAYRFPTVPRWFGLSDARRREVTASADLILDVSGTLEEPERHHGRGRLVYLDPGPAFTQIKLAAGKPEFRARVAAHDAHFSFGERVAALPFAEGFRWRPTRQPVVLEEWWSGAPARDAFTTVMSWTRYPPLHFAGE